MRSHLLKKTARRKTPNLQMIKVLVELGVDITALGKVDTKAWNYQEIDNKKTAAYVLAVGEHWWQPVAPHYLLEVGAETELRTSTGESALQITIRGCFAPYGTPGFLKKAAITALLNHNAKINHVDAAGRSALIETCGESVEVLDISNRMKQT